MNKILLSCVLAGLIGFGMSADAKVGYMYDSQHEFVVYNTSKKATSLTNIATLDFYKTVTKSEQAYYHVTARLTGIMDTTKAENKALLVVDNKMYDLYPTPVNKYSILNGRNSYTLELDYVLPDNLVNVLRNYKSQIGLQIFIPGEKPRILTLDQKGNKELKLITSLKFKDYDDVKNEVIKPEPLE